jgi:hypothetical protein
MRAKYFGVSDEQLIEPKALYNEYKAAIDVYYLLLLIAEHLDINDAYNIQLQEGGLSIYSRDNFQFRHFVGRILSEKLDIKAIYQNPTPENLSKLLALFPVPNNPEDKKASFVKILDKPRDLSKIESDYDFWKVTMQNAFSTRIYYFFEKWHINNCFTGYEPAKKHIQLMEEHLKIVEGAINCKPDNIFDNPLHKDLLCQNFPLVLVSEQADAMRLANSGNEYRAIRTLKFGVDVTMVATDTREHALIVKKWLDQHNLSRVQVVLIHELRGVKDTASRPPMPYQHSDGFSRLAWIAANKVGPEDKSRLKATIDTLCNHSIFNTKGDNAEEWQVYLQKKDEFDRLSEQLRLVGDAERYKSGM